MPFFNSKVSSVGARALALFTIVLVAHLVHQSHAVPIGKVDQNVSQNAYQNFNPAPVPAQPIVKIPQPLAVAMIPQTKPIAAIPQPHAAPKPVLAIKDAVDRIVNAINYPHSPRQPEVLRLTNGDDVLVYEDNTYVTIEDITDDQLARAAPLRSTNGVRADGGNVPLRLTDSHTADGHYRLANGDAPLRLTDGHTYVAVSVSGDDDRQIRLTN